MIRYYKTVNLKLEKLNSYEKGCWVNLVEPTRQEIGMLSNLLNIPEEAIEAPLDEEEMSRIDVDENCTMVLIDIPIDESSSDSTNFTTIPLGIIFNDDVILTVCKYQTKIMNDFIVGHIKDFFTFKKSRFLFQILYKNAQYYLLYLRKINKTMIYIESEIYKSMKNKELLQLLELEKSIIYFSTSLQSIGAVLDKMKKTETIVLYDEDVDLYDDLIIENKQAIDMCKIYGDILSRIMDAFSAIISNNQNNVMQFLTVITLIMSIPTIISGFIGMNVPGIPFEKNPNGFWLIMLVTGIICVVLTIFLSRNKLL